MRIEWYRSATVGIFTNSGISVLCDPWMTDGAFIGSWFHWPPLEGYEFDELVKRPWDFIYISHFHADHFDRRLLAAIVREQPQVRVLIPKYMNAWLKRAVLNCGLTPNRVIELPSNERATFQDLTVSIFVADYCNPQLCGASISCGSTPRRLVANDSVALFEADGQSILNANDALAVETAQRLWPIIGPVDLLLGHFGGAGPYPQCFMDLTEEQKLKKAKATGWAFVHRLSQTAEKLSASFTLPYAGQYMLGGSLSGLNPFRSVIPLEEVVRSMEVSGVTTPVSMAPFSTFDLASGQVAGGTWQEPSAGTVTSYIKRISSALFPYQREEEDWVEGQAVLDRALQGIKLEFDAYLVEGGSGSESSITIRTRDVVGSVDFGVDYCSVSREPEFENQTEIRVDARLLRRLLVRRPGYRGFTQFHFNQAEIGSHLEWWRRGPYPPETQFLNFMNAQEIP